MASPYFLTAIILVVFSGTISSIKVDTTSGVIQGFEQYGVAQFLGIPFAEPPIGNRRFQKPSWKRRMLGTYNGTYFRPQCPQRDPKNEIENMDEDCLYLNIYVKSGTSSHDSKSVMVWIHGGSYFAGSGQLYDGSTLALQQDVIVVNVNYRLGALGFLCTRDKYSIGNFGLWDQTLALEWIRANIWAFGGDREKVTIFGESAGGSSVTQLAISPYTSGLFRAVIAESGTASAQWSHNKDPLKPAQQLARRLGCSTKSNQELVSCMRQIPVNEIVKNQHVIVPVISFSPTYHTEFLPYSPSELRTTQANSTVAKRFAKLEFILGLNSDEFAMFYKDTITPYIERDEVFNEEVGISTEVFDQAVANFARNSLGMDSYLAEKVLPSLNFRYTNWESKDDDLSRSRMIIQMLSDATFYVPIVQFVRTHAFLREKWGLANGTYLYRFNHRGTWMPKNSWRTGADHADEIPFVFGLPLSPFGNGTAAEKDLSRTVMAYWTNFAKTRNPNLPDTRSVQWPVYDTSTERFLELDIQMTTRSVGSYVYNDRMAFWLDYYPQQLELYLREPRPKKC